MTRCRHFLVSGRVQGVFYRASTREQANTLGLTGWVKNLRDGRVELVACGADDRLAQLERWLWQGPQYANVTRVEVGEADAPAVDTFEVRY